VDTNKYLFSQLGLILSSFCRKEEAGVVWPMCK
jgi:hypothetical protein